MKRWILYLLVATPLLAGPGLTLHDPAFVSRFKQSSGGGGGCGAPYLTSCVAWYPFDSNGNDASGNGNNGTLINVPTFITGQVTNAIDFATTSEYMQMSVACGSSLTLSFWVNSDGNGNAYQHICGTSANNGLYVLATGHLDFYNSGDNYSIGVIVPGVWAYVAVTINSGAGTFYINGSASGTFSVSGSSFTFIDMAKNQGGQEFTGLLDDFGFYATALTAAQIGEIYSGGLSGCPLAAH